MNELRLRNKDMVLQVLYWRGSIKSSGTSGPDLERGRHSSSSRSDERRGKPAYLFSFSGLSAFAVLDPNPALCSVAHEAVEVESLYMVRASFFFSSFAAFPRWLRT